jgi:hypothetical protein
MKIPIIILHSLRFQSREVKKIEVNQTFWNKKRQIRKENNSNVNHSFQLLIINILYSNNLGNNILLYK